MQPEAQIDTGRLAAWYDVQAPFYHAWRDDYDAPAVRAAVSALCAAAPKLQVGGDVLDVGCGTGLYSIALARALPACRIVGLDLSCGMLRVAQRQAARRSLANVAFVHGRAEALPFSQGAFAAVLAGGLMANLNDRERAIGEMARVAEPGGVLVLSEFDRASAGAGLRAFIGLMTAGQRCIAALLPRYRFAARRRGGSSFVEAAEVERWLSEASCDIQGVERAGGHFVINARKKPATQSDSPARRAGRGRLG
jgi:ubiquinone/menaquinone biosynthesis C-methylase UbiE